MALPEDREREELITLRDAVPLLKKGSVQAVYRLVNQGGKCRCRRERVYLEVVHNGTQYLTSVEACRRFWERCSPPARGESVRTPAEARRAGRAAGARLRAKLAGGTG